MTISPIQPHRDDYVTRLEFGEFDTRNEKRFQKVENKIDDLKKFVDDGFETTFKHIDSSFHFFEIKIDKRFKELEDKMGAIKMELLYAINSLKNNKHD